MRVFWRFLKICSKISLCLASFSLVTGQMASKKWQSFSLRNQES